MKSILLLLGIALISSACAGVRSRPPAPFKLSDEVKTQGEKEDLYRLYDVENTDGLTSLIGGEYYSSLATERYFKNSDSTDAADKAKEAIEINHFGKKVEYGSLIAGGALGLVGGFAASYQSVPHDGSSLGGGYEVLLVSAASFVVGAGIGGIVGWSIYDQNYYPKAKVKFDEACNSFNRYLGGELHLKVNPTFGGASGAVELTY